MPVFPPNPQLPLGLSLRESARFDSYYPGDNLEALRALQSAVPGAGEPLVFLAGGPGVGKSHLLQAACLAASAAARSVAYLPLGERLAMEPRVLEGLEQQDLVCLDDLDAIAGDSSWEQAVFVLFNRIRDSGGSLLVAAAARPDQCGFGLPDLVSRLGWGVTYVLAPLLDEQMIDALQLRAQGRGLQLPEETARFLLRRMPRDPVSVFGLLDRLDEASMIEQRPLTIPFVKAVLGLG